LEKSGLSNDTRYWFKVVVSDGIDEVASGEGNENTYCLGSYCSGGGYSYPTCTGCSGTGKVDCTASGCVNGYITSGTKPCTNQGCVNGYVICNGTWTSYMAIKKLEHGDGKCAMCSTSLSSSYGYYLCYITCNKCSASWGPEAETCSVSCADNWASSNLAGHYRYGWPCTSGNLIKCLTCKGTGNISNVIECNQCEGTGKIKHSTCSGNGYRTVPYYCSNHRQIYGHYYCTSSSYHGNNVNQYHK